MSGFLNNTLNKDFTTNLFERITFTIESSCKKMQKNLIDKKETIENNELVIQNSLFENYLHNEDFLKEVGLFGFPLCFEIESPVTFDKKTKKYLGRSDIKVTTYNYHFNYSKSDFYIIECKRLDGSNNLNEKYISKGISRFVKEPIKYPTPNHRNLMLGFIVKEINIIENSKKLSIGNKNKFDSIFSRKKIEEDKGLYEYICDYCRKNKNDIQLLHIFFDFSNVIEK